MADKLLLSVSATQVSVARWRGKRFDACETFTQDDEGRARFREFLSQVPRQPVHIVVNAVEEDYRIESLPHTLPFGTDRKEMVGRKLKQYYRNTPYCNALRIGRESDKRRDDRYLLCALTNPDLVKPYVEAILAHDLPLAGVYLLPTVGETLVQKIQIKAQHLLVVTVFNAGLRLSYFRDGKLRTSRLAHVNLNHLQPAQQYAEEISNTRLYLHTLRIMPLDEPLSVVLIDREDKLQELVKILAHDAPNLDVRRVSAQDLVARTGINARMLATAPDALVLHMLGLRTPALNLAPPHVTFGFRRHQIYSALNALSATAAAIFITWCAVNGALIWQAYDKIGDALRKTTQLQAQYQEITRQFPNAPVSADDLKRTVEVARKLNSAEHTPQTMMTLISKTLNDETAITLRSFAWKYDATNAGTEAGNINTRHESGVIEGEVRPFRGDYRAAIATINHFADALAQQPQVEKVDIVKLPLNINPALTLSGNTNDNPDTQTGKAEFTLSLTLKPTT